jgi:D-hexose-6-phosphate mutarotase
MIPYQWNTFEATPLIELTYGIVHYCKMRTHNYEGMKVELFKKIAIHPYFAVGKG